MGAEEQKLPKEVVFEYRRAPEYRVVSANGVWGGVTPRGELFFDLFLEAQPRPDRIFHEVTSDGGLGREIRREPRADGAVFVREAQVGVLIRMEHAKSIAEWILGKVKEISEIRERQEGPQKGRGNA